ncbi:hypothetical protein K461DRAFT_278565 [Myriangium duriaei CBS 260.36]|uniref:Uncharacterized protein n=1 Tax=Myriangium duriaei CBS 260.36 TaxID=1168546 RepID=A0A9P4MFG0_9PEZI|nr:hypothetical protein K461DRAFT_278565 [Myriangium duriaei CBS 260.36]
MERESIGLYPYCSPEQAGPASRCFGPSRSTSSTGLDAKGSTGADSRCRWRGASVLDATPQGPAHPHPEGNGARIGCITYKVSSTVGIHSVSNDCIVLLQALGLNRLVDGMQFLTDGIGTERGQLGCCDLGVLPVLEGGSLRHGSNAPLYIQPPNSVAYSRGEIGPNALLPSIVLLIRPGWYRTRARAETYMSCKRIRLS